MPYRSVTISAEAEQAEALSDALLDAGALSVEVGDADAGLPEEQAIFGEPGAEPSSVWRRNRVVALFGSDADIAAVIPAALEQAGLPAESPYTVEEVAEQDWVRLTQSQFDPIRISDRLWVTPTWHAPPAPDAINLILDPGLAFGTGSHPTTRLCLRWLDANLHGGESVLDYGCGSGILAIAALKLGAGTAAGVDIDAQAVAASRANAEANSVSAEFHTADNAPKIVADLVIANILANPLMVLAPLLAESTRPGGRIVLSGILAPQAAEVENIYRRWFNMDAPIEEEGWVCLSGTRKQS